MPVPSPCIGVCLVDSESTCTGCLRSVEEIAAWSTATDPQRAQILQRVELRSQADRLSDDAIRSHFDNLCKPPGSLGELERLAFELARIQNSLQPKTNPRRAVIFAGDHGVVAQGVSAWPSEVTAGVLGVMTTGRTASGILAKKTETDYRLVNCGCKYLPVLRDHLYAGGKVDRVAIEPYSVAPGTADLKIGPAMSRTQFHLAWKIGVEQANSAADEGMALVIAGEMGIGNTTSAACLTSLLTGLDPSESVGRGAGINSEGLQRKLDVVRIAVGRTRPLVEKMDWKGVGAEVGGFEVIAIAGFFVRAAQRRLTIVLDGYITTAAALLAERMYPGTSRWMIASHLSSECGHGSALESIGLEPMLKWNMRLGEASGALTLLPMLDLAAAITTQMASLSDAASVEPASNR